MNQLLSFPFKHNVVGCIAVVALVLVCGCVHTVDMDPFPFTLDKKVDWGVSQFESDSLGSVIFILTETKKFDSLLVEGGSVAGSSAAGYVFRGGTLRPAALLKSGEPMYFSGIAAGIGIVMSGEISDLPLVLYEEQLCVMDTNYCIASGNFRPVRYEECLQTTSLEYAGLSNDAIKFTKYISNPCNSTVPSVEELNLALGTVADVNGIAVKFEKGDTGTITVVGEDL